MYVFHNIVIERLFFISVKSKLKSTLLQFYCLVTNILEVELQKQYVYLFICLTNLVLLKNHGPVILNQG